MEIVVKNYTYGPDLNAGQYEAYGPDGLFPAWCVDQQQWLYFGQHIEYTLVDGVNAWGAATSMALDQLMSFVEGKGEPTNAEESSTIQHCIWSILDGQPCEIGYKAAPITQHAMQLYSPNFQDLLVTHPITEPIGLAIFGIALLISYSIHKLATSH